MMSLSTLKKRKTDNESRQFKSEWTEKYLFVPVGAKPVCLLCNESISVTKEYNLRRHFKAMHSSFETTFPSGSNACRENIHSLTLCYEQRKAYALNSKSKTSIFSGCMDTNEEEETFH